MLARGSPLDLLVTLVPPLVLGLLLLLLSIFLSTASSGLSRAARLSLAIPALWAFWDFGFAHYVVHEPGVSRQLYCPISTISLYGLMRVLDVNVINAIRNESPSRWLSVYNGKPLPIPTTFYERMAYSLDLLTAMRGTSWLPHRYWEFCPRRLIPSQQPHISRSSFIRRNLLLVIVQILSIDILDILIKCIHFNTLSSVPVSSHASFIIQLFSPIALGCWTYLAVVFPYTLISTICVIAGWTEASAWPSMFDHPFTAKSLSEFWGIRWHLMFRRSFDQLGSVFTSSSSLLTRDPTLKASTRTTRDNANVIQRLALTFILTTLLHLIIMHRNLPDEAHPHFTFLDTSILKFFLSQPIGIVMDSILANATTTGNITPAARIVFAWLWLVWTGRWWADVWVKKGLWDHDQVFLYPSPLRDILGVI